MKHLGLWGKSHNSFATVPSLHRQHLLRTHLSSGVQERLFRDDTLIQHTNMEGISRKEMSHCLIWTQGRQKVTENKDYQKMCGIQNNFGPKMNLY